MTIEDKLNHFKVITMESVQKQCDKEFDEYKKNMDDFYENHVREAKEQSEQRVNILADGISRKASKDYTAKQFELKRNLNTRKQEITKEIFDRVTERLKEYMKTEAYDKLIKKQTDEAKKIAKSNDIVIELASGDGEHIEMLKKYSGLNIKLSDDDFVGGIRAMVPEKNIYIDNSFESMLEEIKEDYILEY